MFLRQLRLWTGLVLASYVIPHLINHSLGLLSLDAMESFRRIVTWIWASPVAGIVLYGSLLLHFLLALWSFYQRSNLRLKAWEATQLGLGLLIPPLIIAHLIGTRLCHELFGTEITYPMVVTILWQDGWRTTRQTLLLLVVWWHLIVGLHFWLRLKPWYSRALPVLYPAAVLLPILALLGFARAGLEAQALATVPGWQDQVFAELRAIDPQGQALLAGLQPIALAIMTGLLLLVLIARLVRHLYRNRFGVFRVRHASGRVISAHVGTTLLEALRAAGIAHASVCGGRARCTTCRVRVSQGLRDLAPPDEIEARALRGIGAPPDVRLACQIRPRRDLAITPLLPATATAQAVGHADSVRGREEPVAVLFLDLRNSTPLGERLLPFDVVYILNQFFAEMVAALRTTGGYYSQFTGDGLMALYGLDSGLESGCRAAIHGAVEMLMRLDALNLRMQPDIGEPLRMGIGIHSGEAIVGKMGPPDAPVISAIGDTVNIAARLEALCKTYDCSLVVSQVTAQRAGIDLSSCPVHVASMRGRRRPVRVYAVSDPGMISGQFTLADRIALAER